MTRHEVIGQVAVFVLLIASITGSVLVLNIKRGGGRHLMPLIDGAFPGGLIAAGSALLFVVVAILLASRNAVGMLAVCSVLLIALHLVSLFAVQERLDSGEPSGERVGWGQLAYGGAVLVQVVAAMIGFVRLRPLKERRLKEH